MNRTAGSPGVSAQSGEGQVERREGDRRPFVAAVRNEPLGGRMHLGQAANLGPTGMQVRRRVHTAEPRLRAQDLMHVAFSLPDGGELLRLRAEVVFDVPEGQSHHLTGLRFAELPAEAQARLQSYLES